MRADVSGITQKGDLVIVKNELGRYAEFNVNEYKDYTAMTEDNVLFLQSNSDPTKRASFPLFHDAKNARKVAVRLNHILTYRRGV